MDIRYQGMCYLSCGPNQDQEFEKVLHTLRAAESPTFRPNLLATDFLSTGSNASGFNLPKSRSTRE